jgi:hypothetical protein
LYVCCEDFADIFWNKSSNEVCSEVIQAKLVLAADMPMVRIGEMTVNNNSCMNVIDLNQLEN